MSKKFYIVPVKIVTNIREPFIDITNLKSFQSKGFTQHNVIS